MDKIVAGGFWSMFGNNLPKRGDRLPVEKFHVRKLNARAEEPFGISEEDRRLIRQLRMGKLVQPFKARQESEGYGVVVGRRRFLAHKVNGTRDFVVGRHCFIEEMSDEEAREASLIENVEILRKSMDPILRAEQLVKIIAFSPSGLRGTARRLGLPASTLSEWLKVLELSPRMQDAVRKELLCHTEAVKLARMSLGKEIQDKLAMVLETEGVESYKRDLLRFLKDKKIKWTRMPKGVYTSFRMTFDKRYTPDVVLYERLVELAKGKEMKVNEYCKLVLMEHVKSPSARL